MAAGAAAGGAVRGELAGQAAVAREQSAREQMAYKQAMLQSMTDYRNRGLDIRGNSNRIRMAMPYIHALADPNNDAWFRRNPEEASRYRSYANGELDPVGSDPNLDPTTGVLRVPGGKAYGVEGPLGLGVGAGGGTGAATGTGTGTTKPTAGPAGPPGTDAGNPANFDALNNYTGPNSQPSPFDTVPSGQPPVSNLLGPSNLGTVRKSVFGAPQMPFQFDTTANPPMPSVFSGEPAGGLPRPPAGPPKGTTTAAGAPPPAETTAAPAAPLPREQDPNSPGYQGYLPGETDKARVARLDTDAHGRVATTGENRLAVETPGIEAGTALKKLQIAKTLQDVLNGPTSFANEQNLKIAQTNLANTTAGVQLKMLGPRIAQIQSEIVHRSNQELQAQNDLDSLNAYRDAELQKGHDAAAVDEKLKAAQIHLANVRADNETYKRSPEYLNFIQAGLNYRAGVVAGSKVMAAPQRIGAITLSPSAKLAPKAAPVVEGAMAGTGGPMLPTGGGGQNRGSLNQGPPAGNLTGTTPQPKPTQQEIAAMKQLISSGQVHASLANRKPEGQARMRWLYQGITGRPLP